MPDFAARPEQLRYLGLLAEKYPTVAAASSEIIKIEALLRLPKGTEHFMSDLHGEDEAFTHILNSASGVIREKIDIVLGEDTPAAERAELATLVYYPNQKLPELKKRQADLPAWYRKTLLRLIDLCRFVSSKHTRAHVRSCLPQGCGYILDELLHAHFEDHDKDLYYGEIIESILRHDRADAYIIRFCEVIKRLAVDRLHIVGDLFDRGPRPDVILDRLMEHHDVDIQWGNHDVVWMGAAAGSPICIATVLKTTLAYNNVDTLERGYGINLRCLEHLAEENYADSDITRWMPHADPRTDTGEENLRRVARMHKAVTVLMLKLEAQVIARNPDFQMNGRDYLNQIDYHAGTVCCGARIYPLLDTDFATVDPLHPERLTRREHNILRDLVRSFRESERLQRHVQFLYAHGAVYKIQNNNLLYHGAVPMTAEGDFAAETFEGKTYAGKALFDYCDRRAREGYFAPEDSPRRQAGQDFLWYL
ncbi:MAG: fructose-bisphosphatase class III, partial [Gemmiger sp.]